MDAGISRCIVNETAVSGLSFLGSVCMYDGDDSIDGVVYLSGGARSLLRVRESVVGFSERGETSLHDAFK